MTTYVAAAASVIAIVLLVSVLANQHARALIRERRLRIDRFKTRRKHAEIRLEVFGSPQVVEAIKHYAKEHKVSISAAEREASIYLMEIVPKFNLLAYYRVGGPVARAILHLLYWVVVDRERMERFNREVEKDAVIVFMINHRSNIDYVLVAHMLFKFISLSYAIGEWARVWPLNHLFKWFGGYFIRRRYREPLYHAVLSQFVATITRSGVTQGVFLEGGLSRDGAFQKPKLGMLDYLVLSKRDPRFTAPLYFLPTAVNYDRVLEDRNLIEELAGKEDRRTRMEKFTSSIDYLFSNFWRGIRGRFKRYGYAMVSFGEPVRLDDFIREHPQVLASTFEERKPHLQKLAELVMERVSAAFPLTPVTLAATVFRERAGEWIEEHELVLAIESARGAMQHRVWRVKELTAEAIWQEARNVLALRRLVEEQDGRWRWTPGEEPLCDYYANAALEFTEVKRRGWPQRSVAAE